VAITLAPVTVLTDIEHERDDDAASFVFRESRPLDLERVEDFLSDIVQVYGTSVAGAPAARGPGT
jgi:G3E family GTPase